MIRAVLFDLDGTVMDSTDAIVESHFHTFDTLGLPRPARDLIIGTIGFPMEKQVPMMTDHDPEVFIPIYRAWYEANSPAMTVLLPGVEETFADLHGRGVRMGFVTSKKRAAAEMLMEHLGALHYMDARIGPMDVTHHKPHPEPVEKAMAQLGVRPEETAFVGDMHFDILAGQAAGALTLAVTTGYETRAQLEALHPAGVYDSMLEVRDHLLPLL